MIITKRIPSRFTCPDLPELRASTTAATQRRSPRAERAIEPSAMREQLKNPAASVGNRAPAHGGEGSGGVLSSVYCSLPLAADRARKPPTLSSLTDEEHVGSLLRSTAARDPVRATTTAADSRCSRRRSAGGDGEQCFFVSSTPTKTVATQRTSPRAERAIEPSAMREQLKNPAASVGNRAPAHGGEGSGGVFPLFVARSRSLRIAPGSRLLCRRSPTKSMSARSSAARRRAVRCERRRRRQPSEHRRERSEQSNRARCASSCGMLTRVSANSPAYWRKFHLLH